MAQVFGGGTASGGASASHDTSAAHFGVAGAHREAGYPIVTTELFSRVFETMVAKELVGRVYDPEAKYLKHRRVLVDWLCEVGEDSKLAMSTVHVAVAYLDMFLQRMDVHRSRLQLAAMACLDVAGKYEEAEERAPTSEAINGLANHAYPPGLIHQMAVLLLNRLGWSLTAVTPMHFLGLFHQQGVLCAGDTMGHRPVTSRLVRYMHKYTDFFADLTLQEYSFYQYRPSLLAAAIVCAARRALAVKPLWNPGLRELLSCDWSDVAGITEHIWQYYAESFPVEVAEHARQERELESADAAAAAAAAPPTDLAATTPRAAANTVLRAGAASATSGVGVLLHAIVTPPDENGAAARTAAAACKDSNNSS